MRLRTWSTDAAGTMQGEGYDLEQEVESFDDAAMVVAEDLLNTASPKFFSQAMREFFQSGRVDKLHEGHGIFWNVSVDNTPIAK